ncbi:hypothetical protein Patl1_23949 [Pistacia atlantica]|uniref:Uncharacterized protein n=1 Tax=Pistacia atlantica TaxID=434234 RepID=A0ACC0ZWQ3_9ROSI|nr:hypothetical protein Patl1_23949 [Pistacia atlantica]
MDVAPTSDSDKSKDVVLLLLGLCLMLESCLGFLVRWSHILSPTCELIAPAQSMWNYLKKVYHQDNDARRFQLEHAIAMFQHGSLSIQDYYSAFLTLWHEYTALVIADAPVAALSTIQNLHKTSQQQRLSTQAILEQSHGNSEMTTMAYVAQRRGSPVTSKNLQCFCCKEYGHIAANCPKKYCSYCKKKGSYYQRMSYPPPNRQAQAFQTSITIPPTATFVAHGPSLGKHSTTLWYVDSGASNHMMNTPTNLSHVRPYAGQFAIQTANGSSLPIAILTTIVLLIFFGDGCVVKDQVTGKPIAKGPKVGRLFPLF